ncbi:MAG TPA: hypothetical protein VML19_33595 [Verrucomicrobiae bacterium]|nr:hypothetical protein [Verrucomicrobiae bacterium]
MILRIAALAALLVGGVVADDDASRAKLMGSWELTDAGKDSQTWTFQAKDAHGDVIHVTNAGAQKTLMEFDCDSFGHDCVVKDNGKTAKVSLYYNGPKLIQMETRGPLICKRAFVITGEGDTMDLVLEIFAPSPKTETFHFRRVSAAAH